jgi:ferrous iron transport protein A
VKSTVSLSDSSVSLTDLQRGDSAWVSALDSSVLSGVNPQEAEAWMARLRDLGFVAGARCEIVARMWFGGDPLAVRIGGSTFALRRAEAAAVRVQRLPEQPIGSGNFETGNTRAAVA